MTIVHRHHRCCRVLKVLACLAVVHFHSAPQLAIADATPPPTLIESEKLFLHHLPPPSDEANDLSSRMQNVARKTGRGPTDQSLLDLLKSSKHKWSVPDLRHVWLTFSHLQKPEVSTADLSETFKGVRDGLSSISIKYRLTSLRGKQSTIQNCVFEMQGDRICFSANSPKSSSGGGNRAYLFDGKNFTSYEVEKDDFQHAAVTAQLERNKFFGRSNPLGLTMTLDSMRDLGATDGAVDIRAFLDDNLAYNGVVREVREQHHGVDCIIVGSLIQRAFLDPARNFAVVGFEELRYQYDKVTGQIVPSTNWTERINHDLVDCGNGLWIPRKSETINWVNGISAAKDITEVIDVSCNKELPASTFTFDFPKGTFVTDHVRGVSYQKGFDPSVEATLDGATVPLSSPQSAFGMWVIILNAIAVIAICSFLIYRRSQKQRQL